MTLEKEQETTGLGLKEEGEVQRNQDSMCRIRAPSILWVLWVLWVLWE